MSDLLRLGHATETTAVIFYRSESDGVLTAECNGDTHIGDTLATATLDGTGIVTVTGLSADSSYPFTLKLGGATVRTGTLMTAASLGQTFSIGYGSCIHPKREYHSMLAMQDKVPNLRGYVFGGDTPYIDQGGFSRNGITLTAVSDVLAASINESTCKSNIYEHNRYMLDRPASKSIIENYPTWAVTDDHERPGDNWDWSVANANKDVTTWAATTGEVRTVGGWCRDVWHTYWKGNPSNSHASNDSARPDDEQLYYDFIAGDAHFIFVEAIEYSDITGGNTLGAAQLTWLLDVLSNSTSPFKVVYCGKTPDGNTIQNWTTALQSHIETNNIYGVVWFGGDIHYPACFYQTGLLQIRPCPTSQTLASIGDGYDNNHIYRATGNTVTGKGEREIFFPSGFVTIEGGD